MNSVDIRYNHVEITVGVYLFKEDNCYIAYCPSLDLYGYDTDKEKAKDDFNYNLRNWLKTQMDNGCLKEDLMSHGWKLTSGGGKEPLIKDIPNKSNINKILNLPEFVKYSTSTQFSRC